ncbi:unannotated protein [freshwater metagenome]|uniref:Unannotated protein n=1 Tax=freshwater metagenome TaxID=449393 RepID=A0A6J6IIJ9_9ZZZZ
MAVEGNERAIVERVGDETRFLHDGDHRSVADRHAGSFLTAVLQGIEAEIGQMRRRLPRGIHTEDAAGLFRGVVVGTGIGCETDIG